MQESVTNSARVRVSKLHEATAGSTIRSEEMNDWSRKNINAAELLRKKKAAILSSLLEPRHIRVGAKQGNATADCLQ